MAVTRRNVAERSSLRMACVGIGKVGDKKLILSSACHNCLLCSASSRYSRPNLRILECPLGSLCIRPSSVMDKNHEWLRALIFL